MRHKIIYKHFKGGAQGVGTNGGTVAVMHVLESSPLFSRPFSPITPCFYGDTFFYVQASGTSRSP